MPAETVELQSVRSRVVADSLQVDFEFAEGRPARYRVHASPDTAKNRTLILEFSGAQAKDPSHLKSPKWAHVMAGADSGILAIRIDLDEPTPWKASWEGNTLRMNILNRVQDGSALKSPWLLGGLGGAIAAGGVVFWLSGMQHSKSPSGDGIIPPPDVVFPQ
jgi:hypothetical protein